MNPRISIILPVLNEALLLASTLARLPAAADLEIILVDGGSADDTWGWRPAIPRSTACGPPAAEAAR